MSTEPKKTSTTWLAGMALVGAVCGALIYSLAVPKEPCPSPVAGITPIAFFDRTNIEAITKASGSWGGRFYLAQKDDGALSVLAAPIRSSGEHIPYTGSTLEFRRFKALVSDRTEMSPLDEANAVRVVTGASTAAKPTWSLDVKSSVLVALLGMKDTNAIGLIERRTTDEDHTFELVPVKLSGGLATPVGTAVDLLVGSAPCPMHCPKEPALYLHRR